MATLNIYLYSPNKKFYILTSIPKDINEFQFKTILREKGYISSYWEAFKKTRIFIINGNQKKEICIGTMHRKITDLGVQNNSRIIIECNVSESEYQYK